MPLVESLRKAFELGNLELAWKWLLTNPDAQYKNYFRHVFKAYSFSSEKNLQSLSERLTSQAYYAEHGIKSYVPKPSGILRPITLLRIEDQIVYQALTNIVADKLLPRVSNYYLKKVHGNMYAGRNSDYFYRRWQIGHGSFRNGIRKDFNEGHIFMASFDLTACFDSIDHHVLKQMLHALSLEQEFASYLCNYLRTWTAASSSSPIYHEHGIPQGPMASGLIAETVLTHFDKQYKESGAVRYHRYVDDIRVMAKTERELRKVLIQLDIRSKEIGLFPQSSKIDIHKVTDIESELKSVSNPPELSIQKPEPDQEKVRQRILNLSKSYVVKGDDATRFKYVLGSALPNVTLARRLTKIIQKQPHLYLSVFNHLHKYEKLSKATTRDYMDLLKTQDLYQSFTANLVVALRGRIHPDFRNELVTICQRLIHKPYAPLVRAAAGSVLLEEGVLTWDKTRALFGASNWWIKSYMLDYVRHDLVGIPTYESLINELLRDESFDVAVVAAEKAIVNNLNIYTPRRDIQKNAQLPLKDAGLIGTVYKDTSHISRLMATTLDSPIADVDWNVILGRQYRNVLRKVVRWYGYCQTDPTAWVQITDTINDQILDALFSHSPLLGQYTLGNIGGVLGPGRFKTHYPYLYRATLTIHNKRLESDLSHPIVRKTGRITRPIEFREMKPLKRLLVDGYLELWSQW